MQHNKANEGESRKGISIKNPKLFADKTARYWWIMQMNPDQKIGEMRGYGKIEGHNENHSKIQNLFRIVNMLYDRGYFYRTRAITIYERIGPLCSLENDDIRMLITHDQIQYIPTGREIEDKPMEQFLNNFNLCIKNGISPRIHLRPITK